MEPKLFFFSYFVNKALCRTDTSVIFLKKYLNNSYSPPPFFRTPSYLPFLLFPFQKLSSDGVLCPRGTYYPPITSSFTSLFLFFRPIFLLHSLFSLNFLCGQYSHFLSKKYRVTGRVMGFHSFSLRNGFGAPELFF